MGNRRATKGTDDEPKRGRGRPREIDDAVMVAFLAPRQLVADIDEWAAAHGHLMRHAGGERSQAIRILTGAKLAEWRRRQSRAARRK